MTRSHDQRGFDARLEWGVEGVRVQGGIAGRLDATDLVPVLAGGAFQAG